ncbi:hypothetical protein [Enorma massiliensis]|uniref:hypothetical protein n=1 Tax=Enorma massiliensis TaxID=1472761 RepID=UPI003AB2F066
MLDEEEFRKAQIDMAAVEFSEKMAIENPGMYNTDEMRELVERHEVSKEEADRIMREDFASMPPEMQKAMKEMLKNTSVSEEVWKEIFGEDFWSPNLCWQLMKRLPDTAIMRGKGAGCATSRTTGSLSFGRNTIKL